MRSERESLTTQSNHWIKAHRPPGWNKGGYGSYCHEHQRDRSAIHTCQLCDANSFEYLIELERHTVELAAKFRQLDALELS